MSKFPKLIALDTDWTIWERYLDQDKWGKGANAAPKVEDNIQRVDRFLLRDQTNYDLWIRVFKDVAAVINDILKNGAQLAIVSRNPSKAMCDKALYYFNTVNPADNKEWSIIDMVKYDEIIDQPKTEHFKRIKGWSGFDYKDMILFDDEQANNVVEKELGVFFKLCPDNKGLTWDVYQDAINAWRNKN